MPTIAVGANAITSIAWSADGKTLALGTATGGCWGWDVSTKTLTKLGEIGPPVHRVLWSPDGQRFAAISGDEHNCLILSKTGNASKLSTTGVIDLAWRADGSQLAILKVDTKGIPIFRFDGTLQNQLDCNTDGMVSGRPLACQYFRRR